MKVIKLFEVGDFVDLTALERGKAVLWGNGKSMGAWNYYEERGLVVDTPGEMAVDGVDGEYSPYYHVLTASDVVVGIHEDDMQNMEYGGHVDLGYLTGKDPEE